MNLRVFAAAALVTAACVVAVDPNGGFYSCQSGVDCGEDWECRPYALREDAGRCFPPGLCADVEQCDGVDDDCDGLVDESFPTADGGCDSGQAGVCADGALACVDGGVSCQPRRAPGAELCNVLDDDCDGETDESFVLASDDLNCGQCGVQCDAGTSCADGGCQETACGDGVDNDGDLASDCVDPSCLGRSCGGGARCGGPVDGGMPDGGPARCFAPESSCADGLDDDVDGLVDCADPDCEGRTCVSGKTCAAGACPP